MATATSLSSDSSTSKQTIVSHHLSRSLERALDEATYTGELLLSGRKLREFPIHQKCDLSDTISAGLLFDFIGLAIDYLLVLDLSRNGFVEFPRILCAFFSLERLNLYHNAIKSIPEQIVQIYMLKVLNLR